LISAYEKGGHWQRALQVYQQLQGEAKGGAGGERAGGGSGGDSPGRGAAHNTAVHNAIVDVLWQTGIVWAQAKALHIYKKVSAKMRRCTGTDDVYFESGIVCHLFCPWLMKQSASLLVWK
jgi:hypothetical protein